MPREIEGVQYFTAAEVIAEVSVSRQSLYRWRKEGKIPAGHRFRDRQVLFTGPEVELIREFANRIEPIRPDTAEGQKQLFGG